jgi:hypothetical protein
VDISEADARAKLLIYLAEQKLILDLAIPVSEWPDTTIEAVLGIIE